MWTDSHIHLCDPRWSDLDQILKKWERLGIKNFCIAGVSPTDWDLQKKLTTRYPNQLWKSFGLHPEWVASQTLESIESSLDLLARHTHECHALGEMGLDWRTPYSESHALQLEAFNSQMELANLAKKPVILHVIHAFHEVQRLWKWQEKPNCSGLVHSFGGSREEAKYYLDHGLYLSLGTLILKRPSAAFIEAIKFIPLEFLLLESDAPDQSVTSQLNESSVVIEIAHKIAEIRGLNPESLLDKTSQNAFNLLGDP